MPNSNKNRQMKEPCAPTFYDVEENEFQRDAENFHYERNERPRKNGIPGVKFISRALAGFRSQKRTQNDALKSTGLDPSFRP